MIEIVVLIIGAPIAAAGAWTYWQAKSKKSERLDEFFDRAVQRGMRLGEAVSELGMREAYGRLRISLSKTVAANPRLYQEALADLTKEEARIIGKVHSTMEAARFRKWIAGLTPADLLDQKAYDALKSYLRFSSDRLKQISPAKGDALDIGPRSR